MQESSIQAFFVLLRAGLWEKDTHFSINREIVFSEVFQLASEQSVIGLIRAGLENVTDVKIPKEILMAFIGDSLQLEHYNKAMNEFIAELIDKLRNKNVFTLLVKGQGIAQCYERPLLRSCGDIDLFLSDDNYEKAKSFLLPFASFSEKEYVRERHLGLTINNWVVELHGSLYCGLSKRIERELDEIKKETFCCGSVRSWDNYGVQVFQLSVENDVFYVFTHILHHFYKEGVGLRQICDWCRLLWTYQQSLIIEKLEKRIKMAGLMTEWKAFGAYAVEYLGIPADSLPFYSPLEKWKRKARRINDFILKVGNMGHNRDFSYLNKYPYLIRKSISLRRRIIDLINHTLIFPMDSLRFFPYMMINGMISAVRRE